MLKTLVLALALAAAPLAAAQADTLTAGQAKTRALGDWSASIYYTDIEGTYEVVVTVAPGPDERGRPLRFVSGLLDGEHQQISLGGFGDDTLLTTLTVSRANGHVSFDVTSRNASRQKTSGTPAN